MMSLQPTEVMNIAVRFEPQENQWITPYRADSINGTKS
jgi:hypothetical protein